VEAEGWGGEKASYVGMEPSRTVRSPLGWDDQHDSKSIRRKAEGTRKGTRGSGQMSTDRGEVGDVR
jgi:hypothetical protein